MHWWSESEETSWCWLEADCSMCIISVLAATVYSCLPPIYQYKLDPSHDALSHVVNYRVTLCHLWVGFIKFSAVLADKLMVEHTTIRVNIKKVTSDHWTVIQIETRRVFDNNPAQIFKFQQKAESEQNIIRIWSRGPKTGHWPLEKASSSIEII